MRYYTPEPVHGFTEAELVDLRNIIERTWNTIASDLFYNDEGKYDESITYKRGDVVEIALDAGRWEEYANEDEKAAIKKLKDLGWQSDAFNEVTNQALPYETYGA